MAGTARTQQEADCEYEGEAPEGNPGSRHHIVLAAEDVHGAQYDGLPPTPLHRVVVVLDREVVSAWREPLANNAVETAVRRRRRLPEPVVEASYSAIVNMVRNVLTVVEVDPLPVSCHLAACLTSARHWRLSRLAEVCVHLDRCGVSRQIQYPVSSRLLGLDVESERVVEDARGSEAARDGDSIWVEGCSVDADVLTGFPVRDCWCAIRPEGGVSCVQTLQLLLAHRSSEAPHLRVDVSELVVDVQVASQVLVHVEGHYTHVRIGTPVERRVRRRRAGRVVVDPSLPDLGAHPIQDDADRRRDEPILDQVEGDPPGGRHVDLEVPHLLRPELAFLELLHPLLDPEEVFLIRL